MPNRLSNLVQRRSFGFGGPEGAAFDDADYQNRLATLANPRLITNESIMRDRNRGPNMLNYIQRTGGQAQDMGPSGREVRIQGLPAILHPNQEDLTVYSPSGKQYQTTMSEQRAIEAERQRQAEMQDIPRRIALAKLAEQEAKAKGGGLSPADQLAREKFEWEKTQAKPQDKGQFERVQTATDALDLIQQAKVIFDEGKATGSWLGKAGDVSAGVFGISTEGAKASAQLKALGGALVAKMPKMTGPQSDKDVQLYREMAGQIADETVPIETRRAALDTVEQIQLKYAGIDGVSQPASSVPKTGHTQDGYIFLGGDPADPKRWRKQ